MREIVHV